MSGVIPALPLKVKMWYNYSMSTEPLNAARKVNEYLKRGVSGIFIVAAINNVGGFLHNSDMPLFAQIGHLSVVGLHKAEDTINGLNVRVLGRFDALVTAYSSTVEETDETPFISADGNQVYDGLIACPRKYGFGTLFRIEGKIYRCGDRMNQKYDDRFDIWKASKEDAIHYGIQTLSTEIVELSP